MNPERIAHLIEVLENVDEAKYYQGRYIRMIRNGIPFTEMVKAPLDESLPEVLKEPPFICHTSACALGWAAFDPDFQAQGLVWRKRIPEADGGSAHRWADFDLESASGPQISVDDVYTVVYDPPGSEWPFTGTTAGREFFELTRNEAMTLFGADPATLTQKINQLKNFLTTGICDSPYAVVS